MNDGSLVHLKCPACGEYIKAPVKDTRMQGDGIFRRRLCERCGRMIVTMERIVRDYEKRRQK